MGDEATFPREVKMRFRTDGWWWEPDGKVEHGEPQPGDTWRIRWKADEGQPEGPIAGYAICCPKCLTVHHWTTANNCGQRDEKGVCVHSGKGSCWNWTGSAEENKLSATPSLFATNPECGWHGHLVDGVLKA